MNQKFNSFSSKSCFHIQSESLRDREKGRGKLEGFWKCRKFRISKSTTEAPAERDQQSTQKKVFNKRKKLGNSTLRESSFKYFHSEETSTSPPGEMDLPAKRSKEQIALIRLCFQTQIFFLYLSIRLLNAKLKECKAVRIKIAKLFFPKRNKTDLDWVMLYILNLELEFKEKV